jgi:TonB-linked SusC/RagA family outer membrane protein
MKLTAFVLLIACLHVCAKGHSQQITLLEKNAPLQDVFKDIQKQSGCDFIYAYELLQRVGNISIDIRNASLREAVEECLKGTPLTFHILDNTVVIQAKRVAAVGTQPVAAIPAPPVEIHGRVVDTAGNPLVGATVMVKGTKIVISTDERGNFSLPDDGHSRTIIISYVGYMAREVRLNAGMSYSISITLRHGDNPLDAVEIVGYGTTSRRFNVGSVSTVDAATIARQPVTNVLLALEGQVPGLAVNATSGAPGSQIQLQIRGQNTMNSSPYGFRPYDQPLFIIDGVPFAPQNNNISQLSYLSNASSYSGGINPSGGLSPFNGINPADIESISILRDADATSIYGTQGSNGVILITTKKGKAGKTSLDITANTGFNMDARTVKLLNTPQYLQLRKDALAADGITPSNNPYAQGYAPDLTVFDQNKYTDWQKVIFGKTSNNTDVHASLSGGTAYTTFLISTGYTRSTYNFPGNFADNRLTLHTSVHHMSMDNRLTVDFGTDFGYDQNTSAGSGGGRDIVLPPNTPDLLDAKGNLLWTYQGVDLGPDQFNAYLKQPAQAHNYNLNNALHLTYRLFTGLTISANMGYSRNTTSEHSVDPTSAQDPLYANSSASFASNAYETINVEPQIDYTHTLGKGTLSALVGGTYKKNDNNGTTTTGYGYTNDNFLGSINGAATVYNYSSATLYKYSAGFARLKYVYDQKYIINLTGRRDGSSNFGPGRQFGDFGSAGVGWIFSEEKGFRSALPFISYAKLSGSYGTSGSDGIGPYQYQAFWQPVGYIPAFQGVHPDIPQNLYNPDYSWALKKSLNISMDLGFFQDRLLINATYYRDREGNQLAGYPLPAQVGFSSVLENLPANVQNKGWEFALTSTNIKTTAFTWSTNFNLTANRNKLLSFPNLKGSSYATQYVIGQPISEVLGYRYKGVDPTTGIFDFYTADGHITNTPTYGLPANGGDLEPIADREIKFMGGFGNNFTYKRLSLYIFLQFTDQTAPNYLATVYGNFTPSIGAYNEPVAVEDYWKNPGDHTALERLTGSYSSAAFNAAGSFATSSGGYSNDTYMRLKTVSLSYTLPDNWLKKLHLRDTRIYVNAQNLLTFTNYKVSDPELFNDYTAFPVQRIVAFGLNLHL